MRRKPPWTIIGLIAVYLVDFVWGLWNEPEGNLGLMVVGAVIYVVFAGIPLSFLWQGSKNAWWYFVALTAVSTISFFFRDTPNDLMAIAWASWLGLRAFFLLHPATRDWVDQPHLEHAETPT